MFKKVKKTKEKNKEIKKNNKSKKKNKPIILIVEYNVVLEV